MSFVFRSFVARFRSGACYECGLWFEEGDEIGYDEDDNLVHADCYEQPVLLHAEPEPRSWNKK